MKSEKKTAPREEGPVCSVHCSGPMARTVPATQEALEKYPSDEIRQTQTKDYNPAHHCPQPSTNQLQAHPKNSG